MMKKYLIFSYAIIGYLFALSTLTFLIFWVYPWDFMPLYIDNPMSNVGMNPLIIDISLLLFFALQHSLMARSFFKDGLFKDISYAVKSATYSLASSLCLLLIYYFWQPLYGYVWVFENSFMSWVLSAVYLTGWFIAFLATFIIDHFELFGLHQGYRVLKNIPEPEITFQVRYFYKYIRHPIQAGTLVGLWATPSMSYTHLLLSIGMTIYVLIGLYFEEKSLLVTFGDAYKNYMKTTPMLIPLIKRN